MDFLTKVLAAMVGRILADDLKAWFPSLTGGLISLAVRRLPSDLQERYAEEWRSHIAEIPGETSKLFCAIGFLWASWRVWQGVWVARLSSSVQKFPGITRVLVYLSIGMSTAVADCIAFDRKSGASFLTIISSIGIIFTLLYFSDLYWNRRTRKEAEEGRKVEEEKK